MKRYDTPSKKPFVYKTSRRVLSKTHIKHDTTCDTIYNDSKLLYGFYIQNFNNIFVISFYYYIKILTYPYLLISQKVSAVG